MQHCSVFINSWRSSTQRLWIATFKSWSSWTRFVMSWNMDHYLFFCWIKNTCRLSIKTEVNACYSFPWNMGSRESELLVRCGLNGNNQASIRSPYKFWSKSDSGELADDVSEEDDFNGFFMDLINCDLFHSPEDLMILGFFMVSSWMKTQWKNRERWPMKNPWKCNENPVKIHVYWPSKP